MKYRQFIKGKAWLDGKPLPEVKSGNVTRKLNGAWQQEDVSTTVNTQNTCARMQHDEPGVTGGIPAGSHLDLRYNFLLQIWDTCRETSVWMEHRALTIRGTSQSAIVRWATGELPLTQSSINRAV